MPVDFSIPEKLRRRILEASGADAQAWLDALPALVRGISALWDFIPRRQLPARYSIVLEGVFEELLEGAPEGMQGFEESAVLKLAFPGNELRSEAAALTAYGGACCVRLLAEDVARGALLLEKLSPGGGLLQCFEQGRDEEATAIAVKVMAHLHGAVDVAGLGNFKTAAHWGRGWRRLEAASDGGTGPFEKRIFAKSQAVFSELLASSSSPVLLHGDLHHENILCAGQNRWVAIDPKGLLGEPEYEAGAWMRNPIGLLAASPKLSEILAGRLDLISEAMGWDRKRLWGWSFSQAVLAAIWAYEDHGAGWQPFIKLAEALEGLE